MINNLFGQKNCIMDSQASLKDEKKKNSIFTKVTLVKLRALKQTLYFIQQ